VTDGTAPDRPAAKTKSKGEITTVLNSTVANTDKKYRKNGKKENNGGNSP